MEFNMDRIKDEDDNPNGVKMFLLLIVGFFSICLLGYILQL